MIPVGGMQISPTELDKVLLTHKDVIVNRIIYENYKYTNSQEAGVIGLPDSIEGEIPAAFVVLKPSATITAVQLQDYVAGSVMNNNNNLNNLLQPA
jgi:acyl-coenzyme A synthetase/AMP-(fatty) acid ligase